MTSDPYHFAVDIGSRYIKYAYVTNKETRRGRIKSEVSRDGVKFERFILALNKTHEDLCEAEVSIVNLRKDADDYVRFESLEEPLYPEELLACLLAEVKSRVRSDRDDGAYKIMLVAEKVNPYECSAIMADLDIVGCVDPASVVKTSYLSSGRNALVVDLGASALKLYLVNTVKAWDRREICDDWSSDEFTVCLHNYLIDTGKGEYLQGSDDLDRCEEIQVALSKQYNVQLSDDQKINRDEFDGCVRQVVDRLMYRIKRFVRARMEIGEELTDVVLIGGCGNVPLVRKTVQTYFNINVLQKDCEYALVSGIGNSFESKLLQSCLKKWKLS